MARWRGAYFSLGGLSQSTDSDKHWLICLHPGCGAKVAGFSNFNSQHRPRHSAWTFTSDKHDKLSLRPSESVLRGVNRPILPGAAGDAAEAALLLDDDEGHEGPPPLVDDEFDHCWAAAKAEAEEQAALLQLDPGDRGDGPVPTTSVIFANAVAELDMLGTYFEA